MKSSLSHYMRSKSYLSLIQEAASNEHEKEHTELNQDIWIKIGETLLSENVPKEKIGSMIQKDVEAILWEKSDKQEDRKDFKWHNGHFYRVIRKQGWNKTNLTPPRDSSSEQRNLESIVRLEKTKRICDIAIAKLKELDSLSNIFSADELKEFYDEWDVILSNVQVSFDEKIKIPENTELLLLNCITPLTTQSLHHMAIQFMVIRTDQLRKEGHALTPKQVKKYKMGGKASTLELLHPNSRDTAIFGKYSGIQCTCESWKVKKIPNTNNLECLKCDRIFPTQSIPKCNNCSIPFYTETIQKMIESKKTKCPNCGEIQILPQEIIVQTS